MTADNVHHKIRRHGNAQVDMNYYSEPNTPPRTPQRPNNQRQGARTHHDGTTKSKGKGKGRQQQQKGAMTSPPIAKSERNISQSVPVKAGRPISSSTSSVAAYAGATFHASPAPSTLPLPSFLKDLSDSPSINSLSAAKDESESTSTSEDSLTPPLSKAAIVDARREDSPLDLLFNADRAEKARAHSASSSTGPFQPPGTRSYPTPGSAQQRRAAGNTTTPSAGIFEMEINESNTDRYESPYQSTYKERIQAARSASGSSVPTAHSQDSPLSKSDALKAYLFSGTTKPPQVTDTENPFGSSLPNTPSSGAFNYQQNGIRSAGNPVRPQFNAFLNDPSIISNSPRGQRTSGLRQEVRAPTTPLRTPDRREGYPSSPSSPTPFRVYKNTPFTTSENANTQPNIQNATTPYNYTGDASRGSDIKIMEDQIRRILKLEDTGVSGFNRNSVSGTASESISTSGRTPPLQGVQNGVLGSM